MNCDDVMMSAHADVMRIKAAFDAGAIGHWTLTMLDVLTWHAYVVACLASALIADSRRITRKGQIVLALGIVAVVYHHHSLITEKQAKLDAQCPVPPGTSWTEKARMQAECLDRAAEKAVKKWEHAINAYAGATLDALKTTEAYLESIDNPTKPVKPNCWDHNNDVKTPLPPPSNGINCWDRNANGVCDAPTEDIDGDGRCSLNDCRGTESSNAAAAYGIHVASLGGSTKSTAASSYGLYVDPPTGATNNYGSVGMGRTSPFVSRRRRRPAAADGPRAENVFEFTEDLARKASVGLVGLAGNVLHIVGIVLMAIITGTLFTVYFVNTPPELEAALRRRRADVSPETSYMDQRSPPAEPHQNPSSQKSSSTSSSDHGRTHEPQWRTSQEEQQESTASAESRGRRRKRRQVSEL